MRRAVDSCAWDEHTVAASNSRNHFHAFRRLYTHVYAAFIFAPMLTVTFLGTSAARPTVERNVSGLALHREGETMLFECGEGTQRQMMRYGVSFALSEIF